MKAVAINGRLATSAAAGLAFVALIVHLLTIHRYGYFRDELYYIACARHGLFWRGNRACDFVNAAASSICAKMDLARRTRRLCHHSAEPDLANRTRLAHLGVVARHRKEQQERRPHALGIFLPTNHLDE